MSALLLKIYQNQGSLKSAQLEKLRKCTCTWQNQNWGGNLFYLDKEVVESLHSHPSSRGGSVNSTIWATLAPRQVQAAIRAAVDDVTRQQVASSRHGEDHSKCDLAVVPHLFAILGSASEKGLDCPGVVLMNILSYFMSATL